MFTESNDDHSHDTRHKSPASIATLAQRQPLHWANVDLSIGPTLAPQRRANIGPTVAH